MADKTPLEVAREAADKLGLTEEDRDDFIEAKMRRAGFKRGPGEWVPEDHDDGTPKDDDGEPMTRGDYRRIQREAKERAARSQTPPKKDPPKTPPKDERGNAWWT